MVNISDVLNHVCNLPWQRAIKYKLPRRAWEVILPSQPPSLLFEGLSGEISKFSLKNIFNHSRPRILQGQVNNFGHIKPLQIVD